MNKNAIFYLKSALWLFCYWIFFIHTNKILEM